MKIYVATTAHGLGHLTRTLPVLDALAREAPGLELTLSSSASAAWVESQLETTVRLVHRSYEPGVAQANCFEIDGPATEAAYRTLVHRREADLLGERDFIESLAPDLVVADVPALAIAAASAAGVRAIGLSNFTWDWILRGLWGEHHPVVRCLENEYAGGHHHLCYPFSPPTTPFAERTDVPLVSRRALHAEKEVRQQLGTGAEPFVLVCPGGWSADDWPAITLDSNEHFVFVGDLPISAPNATHFPHDLPAPLRLVDLVAAADVVVAKPGYGMASECIAHQTPLVSIERPEFPETPVLLEDFRDYGPLAELTLADFFAGRWSDALESARSASTPWREVPDHAAQLVARSILESV